MAAERFDEYEVGLVMETEDATGTQCRRIVSNNYADAVAEPGEKIIGIFWGLYGRTNGIAEHINDFPTQREAFATLRRLTGIRGKADQTFYKVWHPLERTAELETFYDLCINVGHDIEKRGFLHEDSRSVMDTLIQWANEFNEKNKDREWDGEYMEEIDDFYEAKRSKPHKE